MLGLDKGSAFFGSLELTVWFFFWLAYVEWWWRMILQNGEMNSVTDYIEVCVWNYYNKKNVERIYFHFGEGSKLHLTSKRGQSIFNI